MRAQSDLTPGETLLADGALQRPHDRLLLDDPKVGILIHLLPDPLALKRQPILDRRRSFRSPLLLRVEALPRRPKGLVGRVDGIVEVLFVSAVLVEAFEAGEIDVVADGGPELVGRRRVVALGGADEVVELLEFVTFVVEGRLDVLVVVESERVVVLLVAEERAVVTLVEVARLARELVGRSRLLLLDLDLALGLDGRLALALGAGPLRTRGARLAQASEIGLSSA